MAQNLNYHKDIISEHRERMLNLRKYYPFFKMAETSFAQFKEGAFAHLDMGYIVMAVLRFFIEENNFQEKDVTYPEYTAFLTECLKRDFGVEAEPETYKEIGDFVFDKLKNEGKPFTFQYYDPIEKKKRVSRLRMIESRIQDNTVWYSVSPEAVEFYLDTKEIRDESKISVQQLLLEKMIKTQDFKGGIQVVDRINAEVSRLLLQQNEVLALLSADVFAGIEAYDSFVETGMRWFEEEQKLFVKNRELIEAALSRAEAQQNERGVVSEGYRRTIEEIFGLETQLKVAMNRHSQLLSACTGMARSVDEIVKKTKLSRLRSHFDFKGALRDMIAKDRAELLASVLMPMFKPRVGKRFSLFSLDDAVTVRPQRFEEKEELLLEKQEEIRFADEIEDERIGENFAFLMENLLDYLKKKESFTLKEWIGFMREHCGDRLFFNGDFYSFLLHLCQKRAYAIGVEMEGESFLDDIVKHYMKYEGTCRFEVIPLENPEILKIGDIAEISDIAFLLKEA